MTDEVNPEDQAEDLDKNKSAEDEDESPEDKDKEDEDKSDEDDPNKKSEDKKDEDKSGEDKTKRTPRLMEVYKHKIAEKNWNKEKKDLEDKITALNEKTETKTAPEKAKLIKAFAEKSGMDEGTIEELVNIAQSGNSSLTKEVAELKAALKKGDDARMWAEEDKRFEKDYDKNVVSLIETDGVPKENIPRLKKLLKSLAFSEEYAKTPLKVIYRGVDDFRQFSKKGKQSGELSKSGIRGDDTERGYLDLSEEEFNKRIEREAKEAGETKFNIRRSGKAITD